MLDTPPDTPKPAKKKRRGNPDKYRDYMRLYMAEWRARQKIKAKPQEPKP